MATTYSKALDWVFSYIDFSLTHQENIAPEKFNLERMGALLKTLDSPHQAAPSIHIAGTKGKGSVSTLCAAALKAAGLKVGLYTSPHLHDFRERIQINGEPISKADFVRLVEDIKPIVSTIPGITSYEIQTALAFWHFAREKVDIAVLEVGLGGRLDSTNLVTPLVSVITPISLDHTFILGDTLALIAGEKGGIIKPGVPVVSAPQGAEALEVLKTIAGEKQATFTLIGEQVKYEVLSHSLEGQNIRITQDEHSFETKLNLLGAHQAQNAAAAYAALSLARRSGIPLEDEHIRRGFGQAEWPGRFEVASTAPPLVFDGAHNRHSAKILRQAVETYFPGREMHIIFGASEDKDIPGMFAELLPTAKTLLPVRSGHPRAVSVENITQLAAEYPCETLDPMEIEAAIRQATNLAGEYGLVLVTGSLYLVGEVRQVWRDKFTYP